MRAAATGTARAPGGTGISPVAARPGMLERVTRLAPLAPITAPVLLLVALGWWRRWVFEDAFLNFRVVDQIRAGHGPVFNIGQRVEVTTSTLWLWILVVVRSVVPFVSIETSSVLLGLFGTAVGLWWMQRGAGVFWRAGGRSTAPLVPFGVLLGVAVAASWDWATSGLENGLTVAWLGATTLVLARTTTASSRQSTRTLLAAAVVVGLGPLVRPDLTIMSATCLLAMLWCCRRDRRGLLLLAVGFFALPVAYQVFRMGYYASLVPNTALAKAAGSAYWHQGWNYLLDFLMPYWLVVPLVTVVVGAVVLRRADHDVPIVALLALPVAGVVHALYITGSGGDYLHARLLLPSLLAFVAPVAAVPWHRRLLLPVAIVGVWGVVALGWLRPVEHRSAIAVTVTSRNVADGRQLMLAFARPGHHALHASDFTMVDGPLARRLQREHRHALVAAFQPTPILGATPGRTVLVSVTSGVSGYLAGPDVIVHEPQALADPVGSHMPPQPGAAAGHRKRESWEWILAMTTRPGVTGGFDAGQIAAARHAMQCGALAGLLRATFGPHSFGDFWSNVVDARYWTRLSVPRDPYAAERTFCTASR